MTLKTAKDAQMKGSSMLRYKMLGYFFFCAVAAQQQQEISSADGEMSFAEYFIGKDVRRRCVYYLVD